MFPLDVLYAIIKLLEGRRAEVTFVCDGVGVAAAVAFGDVTNESGLVNVDFAALRTDPLPVHYLFVIGQALFTCERPPTGGASELRFHRCCS